ncbi:hypothetical protein NC651_017873 [Populus alba x Populus x berolinensis]|nr:hypothetical protein NC651_017873 [Populus alba x Populus x berolinensis]
MESPFSSLMSVCKLGTHQKMGERWELDNKEREIHLSSPPPLFLIYLEREKKVL